MIAAHLVDGLLGFLLVEGLCLWIWRRWSARGLPAAAYVYSLMSGLALVAALRVVLSGGSVAAMAACLALAGACHAMDLRQRLRSPPAAGSR